MKIIIIDYETIVNRQTRPVICVPANSADSAVSAAMQIEIGKDGTTVNVNSCRIILNIANDSADSAVRHGISRDFSVHMTIQNRSI